MALFLALLPILVILVLLIFFHTPADVAGLIGFAVVAGIAWFYFDTPLLILLKISLAGAVASLPVTLVLTASILQVTVMAESGALARLIALIKTVAPTSPVARMMITNIGVGTVLVALGATPSSILPPILLALGYSSTAAIALPSLGYDALCSYALLGIPVVVFSNFTGLPVNEAGEFFARYVPALALCIPLAMLWITGGLRAVKEGFAAALAAGITSGGVAVWMTRLGLVNLAGVAAGFSVIVVMLLYLRVTRQPLRDRGLLSDADRASEEKMPLRRALSPWLILIGFAAVVNLPFLPVHDLTFNQLAMPVTIIPGATEKLRVFWQAYFWLFVSTFLALPLLRMTPAQTASAFRKWGKRTARPILASVIFFAIAFIINHSGKGLDWQLLDPGKNMVSIIASSASSAFGRMYAFAAPFLGLMAGFVSGSEASGIAMLTNLHLSAAAGAGLNGMAIAAASAIGAGLSSMISPVKLQSGTASIDRIGEEGLVLRMTFGVSLVTTALCALLTLLWAF